MEGSPRRALLYRTLRRAVILALPALLLTGLVLGQSARRPTPSKGPRALGLLELAANGKAHLIPLVILFDGKFYDGSAYKADPVPMALESGTVYEAEATGISKGLFTVSVARQLKDAWIGDGSFQPPSPKTAEKKQPRASRAPDDDVDAPPTLKRPGAKQPEAPSPASDKEKPAPATTAAAPQSAKDPEPPPDPDRPTLRRGVAPQRHSEPEPEPVVPVAKASTPGASQTAAVQVIPAISDANGPEPRPFTYDAKPDDLAKFRKKALALAAAEVIARARQISSQAIAPEPPRRTPRQRSAPAAGPQPNFTDVQLRTFDLSSSNEPVLVLTATARMPQSASPEYYVTLVAREDIYGELHKAFVNVTDNQHLDVLPRIELIDAVDADGDGIGELLFRQISDAGTSYSIYRVVGNQLYALYQGPAT